MEKNKYYTIEHKIVPLHLLDDALRRIYRDIFEYGLSHREIVWWDKAVCWFPHLRSEPEIQQIQKFIAPLAGDAIPCEPQILLSFPVPKDSHHEIVFHQDQEPDWAEGRKYTTIISVPLTSSTLPNGCLIVREENGYQRPVPLDRGDVMLMHPQTWHSGGINRTGVPRITLYFRYIK